MDGSAASAEPRRWRGQTQQERQAERLVRLHDAALAVVAEAGVRGITVRSVCRAAGLTERYFYESYASIDDLVGALYDAVIDETHATVSAAVAAGADAEEKGEGSIRALAELLLSDVAKSRIFGIENSAPASLGAHLERKREMKRELMGDILDTIAGGRLDPIDRELNLRALMASQTQLFLYWTAGEVEVGQDRFVAHLHGILKSVAAVTSVRDQAGAGAKASAQVSPEAIAAR